MKNEEQIEKLAYVLGEIGFDENRIADFLTENFGKEKLLWIQEDNLGKEKVTSEIKLSMDNSSRFYIAESMKVTLDGPSAKSHEFPIKYDFSDVHIREAYNLLSGRGVKKFHPTDDPNTFQGEWMVINNGKLESLPNYDFMAILRELPIKELQLDLTGPKLIYELIIGDRAPILLLPGNVPTPAYLEANPRAGTVNIYDANGTRVDLTALREKGIMKEAKMALPDRKPRIIKRRPGRNKGRKM